MKQQEKEQLLARIKDEVAQEHGYADWLQIDMTDTEQWERDAFKVMAYAHIVDRYAEAYALVMVEEFKKKVVRVINTTDVSDPQDVVDLFEFIRAISPTSKE